MPKDLLPALRKDYEDSPTPSASSRCGLNEFFHEVDLLRDEIDKIENLVDKIKSKHSELLATPNQNQNVKAQVDELMNEIRICSSSVKATLRELESSISQDSTSEAADAIIRIKKTQQTTMARRFMSVMQDYSKTQTDYRDACKARIMRQMAIANREITDDDLENMLESGNPQIFTQSIMADTQQARQTLSDIEARHADIVVLEKSIKELRDMFVELGTIVDSQGEIIDTIEFNVETTKNHVEAANSNINQAVTYKSKARKKKFIIISVVVVLLVILIIILATTIR